MSWDDLATAHQATARHLFVSDDSTYRRAVCNRAYYAAYALVTSRLPAGMSFGHGWHNPQHANLPSFVGNIAGLPETHCREIRRALRRLRQRREDADYRPGISVGRDSARESVRDAGQIFAILTRR